jgi:hypothetical protein
MANSVPKKLKQPLRSLMINSIELATSAEDRVFERISNKKALPDIRKGFYFQIKIT